MNALLMSDEAHFHLSGYVNKQNFRYWAPHNPHGLHQHPLHNLKVMVYCMMSSSGHYFLEDDVECAMTFNTEQYKIMLENFLANELHHCDLPVWFQQDEATAHIARISMMVLH
jgi:hypothetical protein